MCFATKDKKTPAISVIVPVYNVEKYLSGCLDSILNQTFTDFEVICVDDGSPDNSIDILKLYEAKDSRIKIIRQDNQGLSVSRNNAMNMARGEYIFFVDSDDYIAPQALEFLLRGMEECEADLVCGGFTYTGDLYSEIKPDKEYSKVEKIVFNNPLYSYFKERKKIYGMVWNKLYRSEVVKDIRFVPGRLFEDEIFTALVMEKCTKIAYMDFVIYYYFANPKAISRKNMDSKMLQDFIENAEYLCTHFANSKERSIIKRKKVKALLSMCYKKINELQSIEQKKQLFAELKRHVVLMKNKGLISYSDFDIEGKLKLFRLLNII